LNPAGFGKITSPCLCFKREVLWSLSGFVGFFIFSVSLVIVLKKSRSSLLLSAAMLGLTAASRLPDAPLQ
jgi:hypothetical protein